jgi:hypothetical protein
MIHTQVSAVARTPPAVATKSACVAFWQEYQNAAKAPSLGAALVKLITDFFLATDSRTHIALPDKLQTRLNAALADIAKNPMSDTAQLVLQNVMMTVALLQHTTLDDTRVLTPPPPLL